MYKPITKLYKLHVLIVSVNIIGRLKLLRNVIFSIIIKFLIYCLKKYCTNLYDNNLLYKKCINNAIKSLICF